jgi:hypothetical protein
MIRKPVEKRGVPPMTKPLDTVEKKKQPFSPFFMNRCAAQLAKSAGSRRSDRNSANTKPSSPLLSLLHRQRVFRKPQPAQKTHALETIEKKNEIHTRGNGETTDIAQHVCIEKK